ncbi:MAG: glycosyltransferase, partial [Candidatus Delongbacteria bacterium]|nr:glycosyltransferase [Candidatus Delongbacteria bacterium]
MVKDNKNKKINVALLIRDFNMGGIEKVAANLSCILAKYFNVFVLIYNTKSYYDIKGKVIQLDNLKDENYSLLSRSSRNISRIRQIRKIVKENDISVTISFGVNPNMINSLSKNNSKTILTVHSYKSGEEKERGGFHSKFIKMVIKHLYPFASKIVGVSEMVCNDLERNFKIKKQKLKTIYNPFMLNNITSLSKLPLDNEFIHDGKKVLITVGRICKTKAIWHLIRAFGKVIEERGENDLILQIVGNSHDS